MIDTTAIVSFVTGLGAGSILTAIVQHRLTRRAAQEDTATKERRTAIEGFLTAYAALAEGWTDAKAKAFAVSEARIQLVCSQAVVVAVAHLKETHAGTEERAQAQNTMILAMRKDLGMEQ